MALVLTLLKQLGVCSFDRLHPVPLPSTPFSGNRKSGLFPEFFFSLFALFPKYNWGFPGGLVGENPPAVPETQEVRVRGQENPLEEKVRTHSSVLARKIPWTVEPGGLQCVGSQRVRHD